MRESKRNKLYPQLSQKRLVSLFSFEKTVKFLEYTTHTQNHHDKKCFHKLVCWHRKWYNENHSSMKLADHGTHISNISGETHSHDWIWYVLHVSFTSIASKASLQITPLFNTYIVKVVVSQRDNLNPYDI